MTDEKCESCGKPASKKCSRCTSVVYCSQNCQKSDWSTHKRKCNAAVEAAARTKAAKQHHPQNTRSPWAWADNVPAERAYDWLCSCYQLRCWDDAQLLVLAHDAGNTDVAPDHVQHGPAEGSRSTGRSIMEDFLEFCIMARWRKVVPPDWDWDAFVRAAAGSVGQLLSPEMIMQRYGQNTSKGESAVESLRSTAAAIYGSESTLDSQEVEWAARATVDESVQSGGSSKKEPTSLWKDFGGKDCWIYFQQTVKK